MERSNVRVVVNSPEDRVGRKIAASVERLLACTPEKFQAGLEQVLVVRTKELARPLRKKHEKLKDDFYLGMYFRRDRRRRAWIEIYSDGMSASQHAKYLRFPLFRDVFVARVLFHELGHHVNAEIAPERGDAERLADGWRRKLTGHALRSLFPRLFPLVSRFMRSRQRGAKK